MLPPPARETEFSIEPVSEAPKRLRLVLPLAPGVNRQYTLAGRRRVLTPVARAFGRDVKKIIERARLDAVISHELQRELKSAFLGIYLTYFFETPLRRDLDGGLKITLDAVCSALGLDDRNVVDLHLTKQIDPLHPRIEVEIESIQTWSFDRSYVLLEAPGALETSSEAAPPS